MIRGFFTAIGAIVCFILFGKIFLMLLMGIAVSGAYLVALILIFIFVVIGAMV